MATFVFIQEKLEEACLIALIQVNLGLMKNYQLQFEDNAGKDFFNYNDKL